MKGTIELAREAGIFTGGHPMNPLSAYPSDLERFAALVRAQTLEEAAGVCIETGSTRGSCDAAFDIADACADAIRALKGEKA